MGPFLIHDEMLVAPVLSYAGRHYWNELTMQWLHHVQVNSLIGCLPFLSFYILADPSFMMSLNLGGVVRVVPNGTKHAIITYSEHFGQLYINQWLWQVRSASDEV